MRQQPAKWYNFISREKTTKIVIEGTIGDEEGQATSAKEFNAEYARVPKDHKLTVQITSEGGLLIHGLAIYGTLKKHPSHVRTEIVGLAGSAGSVIAMAGNEVAIADGSFVFIHEVSGGHMGTASDLREAAETMDKMTANLIDIYARKTGLSYSRVEEMVRAETWMTAAEAKAYGFADEIMDNGRQAMAACFDFRLLNDDRIPVHIKDSLVAVQPSLMPVEDFDLLYPQKQIPDNAILS